MSAPVILSVLIPAWDEEAAIGAVVGVALTACREAGFAAECLVCVDARTTDRTAMVAQDAGARTVTQQGRGLTGAVLELAEVAAADVCVVIDGDGQHDAHHIPKLAAAVLAGDADLVLGARHPDALRGAFGTGARAAVRHAGAGVLRVATRLALRRDLPDPLTGMFVCRRASLLGLQERPAIAPPAGYKLSAALLSVTLPQRVRHVAVPFLARRGGQSKLDSRVILVTVRQLLRLALKSPGESPRGHKPVLESSAGNGRGTTVR